LILEFSEFRDFRNFTEIMTGFDMYSQQDCSSCEFSSDEFFKPKSYLIEMFGYMLWL